MRIDTGENSLWIEVDMLDHLDQGLDNRRQYARMFVRAAFGDEATLVIPLGVARFTLGIGTLMGRDTIMIAYQLARPDDPSLPREERSYSLENSGEARAMILTPGMGFSGTSATMYNAPSSVELYQKLVDEWESTYPNEEPDWETLNVVAEDRMTGEFNAWYDEMAKMIKEEAK